MPQNSGAGAARTAGLEHVTSECVMFLDSDDLALPDHLDQLRRAYKPNRIVSSQPLHWIVRRSETIGLAAGASLSIPTPNQQLPTILRYNFVSIGVLVSTERLRTAGSFGSRRQSEDWDTWIRLLRHGMIVERPHGASMLYRVHESAVSKQSPYGLLDSNIELLTELANDDQSALADHAARSLRRHRAVHELVTARLLAETGDLRTSRRHYLKAFRIDPLPRRIGPTLPAPLFRGFAGFLPPKL